MHTLLSNRISARFKYRIWPTPVDTRTCGNDSIQVRYVWAGVYRSLEGGDM